MARHQEAKAAEAKAQLEAAEEAVATDGLGPAAEERWLAAQREVKLLEGVVQEIRRQERENEPRQPIFQIAALGCAPRAVSPPRAAAPSRATRVQCSCHPVSSFPHPSRPSLLVLHTPAVLPAAPRWEHQPNVVPASSVRRRWNYLPASNEWQSVGLHR